MIPLNKTYLLKENTHNSPVRVICWPERPCYRKAKCTYCWNRYRKYMLAQTEFAYKKFDFTKHITISFDSTTNTVDAFCILSEIRTILTKKLSKYSKYILAASLGENEGFVCEEYSEIKITPHFHLVASKNVSAELIYEIIRFKFPNTRIIISTKDILSSKRCKRLMGYILDRNVKTALAYVPKKFRLLTASKGLSTGRPKKIIISDLLWN